MAKTEKKDSTESDRNESTNSESKEPTKSEKQQAWEDEMNRLRVEQNIPEGGVPERRDLRYRDTPDSAVVQKLREAGDPRGGQVPAMGYEEYERADSDAQKKKAAEESAGNTRYFAGQRAWIHNPGAPDHGRAIGILRVSEYESELDEIKDRLQGGMGKAKTYECETRDGRAEKMFVSAEHIRPALHEAEWGKSPLMTPIPD